MNKYIDQRVNIQHDMKQDRCTTVACCVNVSFEPISYTYITVFYILFVYLFLKSLSAGQHFIFCNALNLSDTIYTIIYTITLKVERHRLKKNGNSAT